MVEGGQYQEEYEYEKKEDMENLSSGYLLEEDTKVTILINGNEESDSMQPELQTKIQSYINTFRATISEYIQDDIGQEIKVVDFNDGILVSVLQEPNISNHDFFIGEANSLSMAFNKVGKRISDYLEGKNLTDYEARVNGSKGELKRTDIFFGQSLIFIKGYNSDFWTKESVNSDVDTIINNIKKKRQSIKNDL